MLGLSPSIVIVPEPLLKPTQYLLDAYGALDGNTLPCSIVPLIPGTAYAYPKRAPVCLYNAGIPNSVLSTPIMCRCSKSREIKPFGFVQAKSTSYQTIIL